jgi:hypothetical protein
MAKPISALMGCGVLLWVGGKAVVAEVEQARPISSGCFGSGAVDWGFQRAAAMGGWP